MLRELDGIYKQLSTFYFNLILSQYNQTLAREDIYSDYVKSAIMCWKTTADLHKNQMMKSKYFTNICLYRCLMSQF